MNRADISRRAVNFLVFAIPALLAYGVFRIVDGTFDVTSEDRTIEAATMAALAGYSFTAAFFLVALPRNGYLARLDAKNLTLGYTSFIAAPALFGVAELGLSYVSALKPAVPTTIGKHLGVAAGYLFFATILYFVVSVVFLLRIVQLHRRTKIGGTQG